MEKQHHWKINGRYYEVSQKQRQLFKKEYDRHKRLETAERATTILSFDALGEQGVSGEVIMADLTVNIEDEIIDKLIIGKLKTTILMLSPDEQYLVELLYSQMKTIREAASILGVSKSTLVEKRDRVLKKLKKLI